MSKRILSVLFMVLLINCLFAQELRSTLAYEKNLSKRFSTEVQLGVRNHTRPEVQQYFFVLTGAKYKITKWLKLAGDFRYGTGNFNENIELRDDDYNIYRSGFELTFKMAPKEWDYKLSYRIRYQHNYESDNEYENTLRHRVKIEREFNKKIEPHLSFEAFINADNHRFKKLRFKLGNEFDFEFLKIEVYFFSDNQFTYDHYFYFRQTQALGVNFIF